jgi:hypothetical protein
MAGGALLAAVTLYMVASAVRIYARKYYLFLPDYLRWTVTAHAIAGLGADPRLFPVCRPLRAGLERRPDTPLG